MREDFMKCIYKSIAEKLNRDELNDYFRSHTGLETSERFNFHPRYLYRILDYLHIERKNKEEYSNIVRTKCCTPERNKKVSNSNKGRTFSDVTSTLNPKIYS